MKPASIGSGSTGSKQTDNRNSNNPANSDLYQYALRSKVTIPDSPPHRAEQKNSAEKATEDTDAEMLSIFFERVVAGMQRKYPTGALGRKWSFNVPIAAEALERGKSKAFVVAYSAMDREALSNLIRNKVIEMNS